MRGMAVTIPQVEASSPDTLTQAGADLGHKATGLADRISRQRSAIARLRIGWQGSASDAAVAKHGLTPKAAIAAGGISQDQGHGRNSIAVLPIRIGVAIGTRTAVVTFALSR